MVHILLVEDETTLGETLAFLLEREGFTVTLVTDGAAALSAFDASRHDLVLLDLMLPEVSGTEVCRRIRAQAQTPIIMLTAKDSEVDIVVGLELGADDFVLKPYKSSELLARIRAVLRRSAPNEESSHQESALEIGRIRLDAQRHSLEVDGVLTPIPLKEFELLEYLMENAGRVLTRAQLIDHVWGSNYFGDTKTLDVHIKRIRGRIEEDPANPVHLATVRGLGYRFEK